jgi:hypothetical protein
VASQGLGSMELDKVNHVVYIPCHHGMACPQVAVEDTASRDEE